ncbi:DUF2726 domain-containing protein [Erythrobacteraceae bacterium CFH 75059]|nr:DUF2726 domain-containing protein [Erythrobacteraceae bacterium CFH 75059]
MDTARLVLDDTSLVLIVLCILFVAGRVIAYSPRMRRHEGNRPWRSRPRGVGRRRPPPSAGPAASARDSDAADLAAEQLKAVSRASYKARPLLNRPEAAVFKALDAAVVGRNPSWQVMAQVSLGEFLTASDKSAFLAINSKRVDFALMNEQCQVVHALEYQGTGHYRGQSAAARDAVKKEALRKAGIGYHEIVAGHTTPSELRALVGKLVPAARDEQAA